MNVVIDKYYDKGLLEQIAPYAMFALSVIGIIIVVLIATQFLTAALTSHLGAITESTRAVVELTNSLVNGTRGGMPPV